MLRSSEEEMPQYACTLTPFYPEDDPTTIYNCHLPPTTYVGYLEFMETEGGRKCPRCGRYAKRWHLGNLSYSFYMPAPDWKGEAWALQYPWLARARFAGHITMFGHLPGYGCNRKESVAK